MKYGITIDDELAQLLSSVLNKVDNAVARDFYHRELHSTNIDYLAQGDIDTITFLPTKAVVEEGATPWTSKYRQSLGVEKLANKCMYGTPIQKELVTWANCLKALLLKNHFEVGLVEGEDLRWSYSRFNSSLHFGCMSAELGQIAVQHYINNGVKLLRLMKNELVHARALLWEGVEVGPVPDYKYSDEEVKLLERNKVVKFLDVPYYNQKCESHKAFLINWAKENGVKAFSWKTRNPSFILLEDKVIPAVLRFKAPNHKDLIAYPYIDTMSFWSEGVFSNHPPEGQFYCYRVVNGGKRVEFKSSYKETLLELCSDSDGEKSKYFIATSNIDLYKKLLPKTIKKVAMPESEVLGALTEIRVAPANGGRVDQPPIFSFIRERV